MYLFVQSWWRSQLIDYCTLHGAASYCPRLINDSTTFESLSDFKTINIVAIGAGATGKFFQGKHTSRLRGD